jgi:hypothetical protein
VDRLKKKKNLPLKKNKKTAQKGGFFFENYLATNGRKAIKRARLIASAVSLWCFEQQPDFFFGFIFPDLEIYLDNTLVS